MRRLKTLRRPPIYPKTPGHLPCSSLTHPLPLSSRRPSVSFGGFGLSCRVYRGHVDVSRHGRSPAQFRQCPSGRRRRPPFSVRGVGVTDICRCLDTPQAGQGDSGLSRSPLVRRTSRCTYRIVPAIRQRKEWQSVRLPHGCHSDDRRSDISLDGVALEARRGRFQVS